MDFGLEREALDQLINSIFGRLLSSISEDLPAIAKPKHKMNQLSTTLVVLSTLAAAATGKTIRGGEQQRELERNLIIDGSEAQEDRYAFAVSLQDRIG